MRRGVSVVVCRFWKNLQDVLNSFILSPSLPRRSHRSSSNSSGNGSGSGSRSDGVGSGIFIMVIIIVIIRNSIRIGRSSGSSISR